MRLIAEAVTDALNEAVESCGLSTGTPALLSAMAKSLEQCASAQSPPWVKSGSQARSTPTFGRLDGVEQRVPEPVMRAAAAVASACASARDAGAGASSNTGSAADAVRRMLLASSQLAREGTSSLQMLERGQRGSSVESSRAAYLLTMEEMIGSEEDNGKSWRDEWVALNEETAALQGWLFDKADAMEGGRFSQASKLANYPGQVAFKLGRGWTREDAEAHTCLSGVCLTAISRALREEDDTLRRRYKASTYALYNSLSRAAKAQPEPAPPVYGWIAGGRGLAQTVDPRFVDLSSPDAFGFCGFTAAGEVAMVGPATSGADPVDCMFPSEGCAPRVRVIQQGEVCCALPATAAWLLPGCCLIKLTYSPAALPLLLLYLYCYPGIE